MNKHAMKPIWYFVGLILSVMGILIFLSGIYQVIEPPSTKTILASLHPDIWWGGFMVLVGGFMYFMSRKKSN
jgi:hypothetical protein